MRQAEAAVPMSLQRLSEVLNRFDITIAKAEDMLALKDYRFTIIADDSGSMQNSAVPSHMRQRCRKQCAERRTRWSELREVVAEVVDVAACLGSDGVDVHFLNRSSVYGARGSTDPRLLQEFESQPLGGTPLTKTVQRLANTLDPDEEMLLFIFTDGEPDYGRGPFQQALRRLLDSASVHVCIMAFSEDEGVAKWFGSLEHTFSEVEFSDDFFTERRAVLRNGLATRFTRGDWCMKAMLAAATDKFAMWKKVLHKDVDNIVVCDHSQCQVM